MSEPKLQGLSIRHKINTSGADPVALDAHFSDDFDKNKRQVVVSDDLVSNDLDKPGGERRNPYKSYGYLRTPELSRRIATLLQLKQR